MRRSAPPSPASAPATEASRRIPGAGLDALLEAVPELDRSEQQRQLDAVLPAFGSSRALNRTVLERWARWEVTHGVVATRPDVGRTFDFSVAR